MKELKTTEGKRGPFENWTLGFGSAWIRKPGFENYTEDAFKKLKKQPLVRKSASTHDITFRHGCSLQRTQETMDVTTLGHGGLSSVAVVTFLKIGIIKKQQFQNRF